MKLILKYISLIKTIYFNFKYFPAKTALRFPVIISRSTKLSQLKGKIIIDAPIKTGMIRIGFGNVPIFDRIKSRTILNMVSGTVVFKGQADIGHGSRIGCSGRLEFGNNFVITAESMIVCNYHIQFGDDVLVSWKCQIMDTDFHKVLSNDKVMNPDMKIEIGNKVWIGSYVIVNKGVLIAANSVIAAGSVIRGKFNHENSLLCGNPATVLWSGISWK
jgi:acetyltransferase-like isoleucine patch superfamily enzyme